MKETIEQQIELLKAVNLGVLTNKETNGINAAITRLNGLLNNETIGKYPVTTCSPDAMELINLATFLQGSIEKLGINGKYPFGQLLIGQSFTIPFVEGRTRGCLESCQRSYASRTGKTFRVLSHGKLALFEVVRLS